jgi:penicillin amidase
MRRPASLALLPLFIILAGLSFFCSEGRGGQDVEILRDPWGIPHVFAGDEPAGFFGLGHACAEDRILQMDLLRRRAAGRLAEVFGRESVDSDREARIAGHRGHAAAALSKLPQEHRSWLSAYAAGINSWIATHQDVVARRFKPLGVLPEPWTPADCLLVARGLLSLGSPFTEGPIAEYHRLEELTARMVEAEALGQFRMVVDDAAAIVTEADMARDGDAYRRLKARARMPGFNLRAAPGEGPKMSHAWAVGGRRSATGKPILESDPQLTLSTPPFFYEFHLAAGRIDARGLGLPGCPGLFIGWNRKIAWGASALGANATAVFLDRLAPDGKGFLFEEKAVPFDRRLERIRVKGGPDVVQEVLANRHGVVFNSLARNSRPGEAYVLHDAQVQEGGTDVRALLEFLTAGSWGEFRASVERYYDPGLHIVYADVEGNIGYQTMVHRPFTARSPRLAQEGWTGRQEISGRIPLDEMPHVLNPEAGFISHANNMPVGSWYPHELGIGTGGTGHTSRSWRLRQLLEGERKYSVGDFEAIVHRDDLNPLVAALFPAASKVVEEDRVADPAVLRLLADLKGWDLRAGSAGRFPAARTLENTLTPYRRAGLQDIYGAGGGGIAHLARTVGEAYARDGTTPRLPAVREYLVNWLRAAAGSGGRGGGGEVPASREGRGRPEASRGRESTIRIPYQRTIPLNFPAVDPSLDIMSPPLVCLDTGTIWSQPGNVYTQIVDLADVDASRAMIAPGNAEDAGSPFRTAGIEIWAKGGTRPAPLSRPKVEALGATRTAVTVKPYEGPEAPAALTVDRVEPGWRLVAALPEPTPEAKAAEARPLPGRKPDDPRLESAFRAILRNTSTPEEIDGRIAECRAIAKGDAGLTEQLRQAAILGAYLIEEAAAGRLKVPYGSPHALRRLKELLGALGGSEAQGGRTSDDPGAGPRSAAASPGEAVSGAVLVPIISGRPERRPFAGHPGWIDVNAAGESSGASARVGDDARFKAPRASGALILTLDRMEIPPVVIPRWPGPGGERDVAIPVEYACVPPGYPETWLRDYAVREHTYWQTFVALSRHLYGLMAFDGRKVIWWGNKMTASVYRDRPGGSRIDFKAPWGVSENDNPSAHHTDQGFPRVGFRHGDIDMVPGRTYAVRVTGYKSHSQVNFELPAFIRPDGGDGYAQGEAWRGGARTGGDLCLLLFGSGHGQYIENHVRSEEWNLFIVKRPPVRRWGQTFVPHGVSLAGLRLWGNSGGPDPVSCRIAILVDGPGGRAVGPAKTAVSHDMGVEPVLRDTSDRPAGEPPLAMAGAPAIRYPNEPGVLPGHERHYRLPHDLFQAAYIPDEAPLVPGKTYSIDLEFDRPMMVFADGDFYEPGYLYHDGRRADREPGIQHGDPRGTLLVDIVTYAQPGGGEER